MSSCIHTFYSLNWVQVVQEISQNLHPLPQYEHSLRSVNYFGSYFYFTTWNCNFFDFSVVTYLFVLQILSDTVLFGLLHRAFFINWKSSHISETDKASLQVLQYLSAKICNVFLSKLSQNKTCLLPKQDVFILQLFSLFLSLTPTHCIPIYPACGFVWSLGVFSHSHKSATLLISWVLSF